MKVYMVNGMLFEAKNKAHARRMAADRIIEVPRLATGQEIHSAGMRREKIHSDTDGTMDAFIDHSSTSAFRERERSE